MSGRYLATDLSIEIPLEHGTETVLIQPGDVTLSPGLSRIIAPQALTDLIGMANTVADDLDNLTSSLNLIETMKEAFMRTRIDQFAQEVKVLKGYEPTTEDLRRFLVDRMQHAASLTEKLGGVMRLIGAEGEAGEEVG